VDRVHQHPEKGEKKQKENKFASREGDRFDHSQAQKVWGEWEWRAVPRDGMRGKGDLMGGGGLVGRGQTRFDEPRRQRVT